VSLRRQGGHYILIGLLQYVVDWGVMVGLSHVGLSVELANVAGRVSGAVLGFWLNGRITFAGEDTALGGPQLARFVLLWLCTTAASTLAIGAIEDAAGLKWAWMAKPGVEMLLAGMSFLVSRHWVYRR
jgi:putative flippase GtrA